MNPDEQKRLAQAIAAGNIYGAMVASGRHDANDATADQAVAAAKRIVAEVYGTPPAPAAT